MPRLGHNPPVLQVRRECTWLGHTCPLGFSGVILMTTDFMKHLGAHACSLGVSSHETKRQAALLSSNPSTEAEGRSSRPELHNETVKTIIKRKQKE
jgi:hypothetical protein